MMDVVSNFHFIRPAWWLLSLLVVGVWWLWQRRTDPLRGWRDQIEPELLNALVVGREGLNRRAARVLLVVWLLATVALAGPTWRFEPSPFADDATPVMILLKASPSMETPDPAPSRLERGRLKIADFAAARKGQPLGLIAYAGSAHLVLPPTRDTEIVAKMASEITPEIMPVAGDRLDLALKKAGDVLSQGKQGGTILVMADSVETAGPALSSWAGVSVHFLAINTAGSPQDRSLRTAASALRATVQPLRVDDEDIATLVRRSARPPTAQASDQSNRWEEAGFGIVPLIALLYLATIRRETTSPEVPA